MTPPPPEVMRPYLRVSDAQQGKSESVAEQLDELADDADSHGWQLGEPYADDGISASRYGVKIRGDFQRLMADLEAGTFGAAILGAWEGSRPSRQVEEWLPLVNLLATARVRLWIHDEQRLYDPRVPKDRADLLKGAADAELESAKTSMRVRRTVAREAKAGKPHGPAPYGYTRRYHPETRELLEQVIVEQEAEVIRHIFEQLDTGHSLRSIAKKLELKGVRSRSGLVLDERVIRQMAMRETYAGRRRHASRADRRTGQVYEATWPAIVEPELFDRVNARLASPERRTFRNGQGKHLLTMLVYCDACDEPLSAGRRRGIWVLRCDRSCGRQVEEALLDQIATDAMHLYLSRPDVYEAVTADRGESPELAKVRADLAASRLQHAELTAAVAKRQISIAMAAQAEPPLLAEIARLEKREQELSVPSALVGFVGPLEEVQARWAAAPLSARRAVARVLLSPGLIGQLRVGPVKTNRWCADPEHEKPVPSCRHRVADRLVWVRERPKM